MKLDKKQVPQLVVLGLLVMTCIGYVSFTVMKPPATEPAPAPKQAASRSAGKAMIRLAAQPIPATSTFPDLSAPIPRRDPFTTQALDVEPLVQPSSIKPIAVKTSQIRVASGKVPPLTPIGSFSPGSTVRQPAFGSGLSAVPSESRDPSFVLTGVIRGVQNVAIIRVGPSERYVVTQGQTIRGRYRVLHVFHDAVVLDCNDHRIHLKLGGVRNAS